MGRDSIAATGSFHPVSAAALLRVRFVSSWDVGGLLQPWVGPLLRLKRKLLRFSFFAVWNHNMRAPDSHAPFGTGAYAMFNPSSPRSYFSPFSACVVWGTEKMSVDWAVDVLHENAHMRLSNCALGHFIRCAGEAVFAGIRHIVLHPEAQPHAIRVPGLEDSPPVDVRLRFVRALIDSSMLVVETIAFLEGSLAISLEFPSSVPADVHRRLTMLLNHAGPCYRASLPRFDDILQLCFEVFRKDVAMVPLAADYALNYPAWDLLSSDIFPRSTRSTREGPLASRAPEAAQQKELRAVTQTIASGDWESPTERFVHALREISRSLGRSPLHSHRARLRRLLGDFPGIGTAAVLRDTDPAELPIPNIAPFQAEIGPAVDLSKRIWQRVSPALRFRPPTGDENEWMTLHNPVSRLDRKPFPFIALQRNPDCGTYTAFHLASDPHDLTAATHALEHEWLIHQLTSREGGLCCLCDVAENWKCPGSCRSSAHPRRAILSGLWRLTEQRVDAPEEHSWSKPQCIE